MPFQCSSASRKFLNYEENVGEVAGEFSFSALQRAENFSIERIHLASTSPGSFSALQRAENFSMSKDDALRLLEERFQCSSASRKFLNRRPACSKRSAMQVSVLFSEPKISQSDRSSAISAGSRVSVLFSEPKISQSRRASVTYNRIELVSVLFSEPKISQSC